MNESSDDDRQARRRTLPREEPSAHPLRSALLDLLSRTEQATASEAARQLGVSSGLCSFHLRRLGSAGLIEEVRQDGGVSRPWRLAGERPPPETSGDDFDAFQRGLEDESYRRWTAERATAPQPWRQEDAFSAVLHLTPAELAALGDRVRAILAPYRARDWLPDTRPADSAPVAVVSRIFPILPAGPAPED